MPRGSESSRKRQRRKGSKQGRPSNKRARVREDSLSNKSSVVPESSANPSCASLKVEADVDGRPGGPFPLDASPRPHTLSMDDPAAVVEGRVDPSVDQSTGDDDGLGVEASDGRPGEDEGTSRAWREEGGPGDQGDRGSGQAQGPAENGGDGNGDVGGAASDGGSVSVKEEEKGEGSGPPGPGEGVAGRGGGMDDLGEEEREELMKYTAGTHTRREEELVRTEKKGVYAVHYVRNDATPQQWMRLVGLMNVYSKQLPNMPKEYICRLIFNHNHRSVAITRDGNYVLAGITYRIFPGQRFGEIAFCAVIGTEQVKGYGGRAMNHAKMMARRNDNLTHFLTYADNNAVGFFMKQGFTKEITLKNKEWSGYIKDYDGGTLMEFAIHHKIDYTNFPLMIRRQRAALDRKIRGLSNSHVVHPGLSQFASGRRVSIPVADIPGIRDAGWTPDSHPPPNYKIRVRDSFVEPTLDHLYTFLNLVLRKVKSHEDAWPFVEPVDSAEVPDYYDIVKDPVDLGLIQDRLKGRNYYITLDIFRADFRQMFKNCRHYNASDTVYYRAANRLEGFLDNFLENNVVYD